MKRKTEGYSTANFVFDVTEFASWSIFLFGVMATISGLWNGSAFSSYWPDHSFAARVISALPGIAIMAFGILSVASVQVGRAAVDTAINTSELLKLAHKKNEAIGFGGRPSKPEPPLKGTVQKTPPIKR